MLKKWVPLVVIICALLTGFAAHTGDANEGSGTGRIKKIYARYCAGCHGPQMEAFVDRRWKYGTHPDSIYNSIAFGKPDFGMPAYKESIRPKDIRKMAALMAEYIKNVNSYQPAARPSTAIFESEGMRVALDTIATGLSSPWGFAQLPDGNFLITDRAGFLYLTDQHQNKTLIKGTPDVLAEGQGGLLDVKLHPAYETNGWVYLSWSKYKTDGKNKLSTTAITRGRIKNNEFTDAQEIFEAQPYTRTRHHYGSKMVFDGKGYLYFTVGERGREKEFPQLLNNHNGKVHRLHDDGRIPADNPFVNDTAAKASIYSYGHRNPQGIVLDTETGLLWAHEHGPRGGDELNIVRPGANYGWPVITYGINYNGTPVSNITTKEGMEQPVIYWTPSIAPCGMAIVTGSRYPAWKGNIMTGSLRFNYLSRCAIKNGRVTAQEKLLVNLGRMRNVEMGRDGYLYVGIENPGMVFRLRPLQ